MPGPPAASLSLVELTALMEHSSIRPAWAPDRPYLSLQWPRKLADRVKVYGTNSGAILLIRQPDNSWDWHWLFTPACRGKPVLLLARKVLAEVFTNLQGAAIGGAVPRDNRAARTMSRAIGALPVGTSTDRFGRPCINYRLERERWVTL